jgi:hypothetical protein
MENRVEIPQKFKIDLPCVPEVPFLGLNSMEMKSASQRDISMDKFIA